MVASSRILHLAAAAATTAVATCFACPGRISGAGSCTPGSTSAADGAVTPPRTASVRRLAASCGGVDGGRKPSRSSTAVCAISSAQEESAVLRTRGGGSAASGVNDPGLSETDDEVWQIINAERRRQVRGSVGVAHRASQTRFAGGVLSASLGLLRQERTNGASATKSIIFQEVSPRSEAGGIMNNLANLKSKVAVDRSRRFGHGLLFRLS